MQKQVSNILNESNVWPQRIRLCLCIMSSITVLHQALTPKNSSSAFVTHQQHLTERYLKCWVGTNLQIKLHLLYLFCLLLLFKNNEEQSTISSACLDEDLICLNCKQHLSE